MGVCHWFLCLTMAQHFQPVSYFECHLCFALVAYCLTSNCIYHQTYRRTERENGLLWGYIGNIFLSWGQTVFSKIYHSIAPQCWEGRSNAAALPDLCQPEHTNTQNCLKPYFFLSIPKQGLCSPCIMKVVTGHWPRTVIWYCCLEE